MLSTMHPQAAQAQTVIYNNTSGESYISDVYYTTTGFGVNVISTGAYNSTGVAWKVSSISFGLVNFNTSAVTVEEAFQFYANPTYSTLASNTTPVNPSASQINGGGAANDKGVYLDTLTLSADTYYTGLSYTIPTADPLYIPASKTGVTPLTVTMTAYTSYTSGATFSYYEPKVYPLFSPFSDTTVGSNPTGASPGNSTYIFWDYEPAPSSGYIALANDSGGNPGYDYTESVGSTYDNIGFSISGTVVPAPPSLVLMLFGATPLLTRVRRRRVKRRSGEFVPPKETSIPNASPPTDT